VTGSGRGLGRYIAMALSDEGANVVLMSRTIAELRRVEKEINKSDKVLSFAGNVSKESDVKKMVEITLSKFGTIDILVNNAGTIGNIGPVNGTNLKEWAKTIEVNLLGTLTCTSAVLPTMIAKRSGRIINIAGAGEGAFPNFSAYASSKSAIIRLTETLAEEVRQYNVFVNAIAPGSINTKMTEEIFNSKHSGEKEVERTKKVMSTGGIPIELPASLVVFLASKESDGITGKFISTVHDNWKAFGSMKKEIDGTDLYTMRRVSPNFIEKLKSAKGKGDKK
jgi:NAD(P)-dependent dehydrogenase (short-subunit alcohol dehydrogenase family)